MQPPHGWNAACPHRLYVDEAHVAMLDAKRNSFLRTNIGSERLIDIMDNITRNLGGE